MTVSKENISSLSFNANGIYPKQWVKNHADYLYNFALFRIKDEESAKDLVQETFLAALEKMEKFEGKSTERTWLTAILKNKIIDIYRKKTVGLSKAADTIKVEREQSDFFNPDDGHWNEAHRPQLYGLEDQDWIGNKEFAQFLQKCMQKLPSLWLAVFTMKHMDDELTKTICSKLKVTPANFWVIIHRTKLNLRSCLQKNWP